MANVEIKSKSITKERTISTASTIDAEENIQAPLAFKLVQAS